VSEATENEIVASGGFMVPPGIFDVFADGLRRGFQFQVARGWVYHRHPQTAIEVVREKLELARSENPDEPEGFYATSRFGDPALNSVWD
jgi:hypothetical protein